MISDQDLAISNILNEKQDNFFLIYVQKLQFFLAGSLVRVFLLV